MVEGMLFGFLVGALITLMVLFIKTWNQKCSECGKVKGLFKCHEDG